MSGDSTLLSLHIMDFEYRVSCPPEEREALTEAARYLNDKMREVRDSGKVLGTERIAVTAGLHLAFELLGRRAEVRQEQALTDERLRGLVEKLDHALHKDHEVQL